MRPQGSRQDLSKEDHRLADILGAVEASRPLDRASAGRGSYGRRDAANHEGAAVAHE